MKERLSDGAVARIEGFVAQPGPHLSLGLHALLLLVAAVVGIALPAVATPVTAVLTASLLGEGTGRFSLLRWVLPRVPSYNLVVRAGPNADRPGLTTEGSRIGSVLVAAPLDVPRWRPAHPGWSRFRPLRLVFASAVAVTLILAARSLAEPWGPYTGTVYGAALAVLAGAVVVGALVHRAGEGTDDGGAPSVLLELERLLRERPLEGVDLWIAFLGCGRVTRGGMDAFLALHRRTLQSPCLVVVLDDAGRPPLRAVGSEGSLYPQHPRPTGPALVERLRWAGVDVPFVDRPSPTDARTAMLRGFRSVALTGGSGPADPTAVARAADVVETMLRWYEGDLHRVADDRSTVEAFARAPPPAPRAATPAPAAKTTRPAPTGTEEP